MREAAMRLRLAFFGLLLLLPVEGKFLDTSIESRLQEMPRDTLLVIFNHGYASSKKGSYEPEFPKIVRLMRQGNDDVTAYAQVRNSTHLSSNAHAGFVESAIAHFHGKYKIPVENMILVGESCGGWASLQAALKYPNVGGVIAFAPACHGKIGSRFNRSPATQKDRAAELGRLARDFRSPALIFLYENDPYYRLGDWDGFAAGASARSPYLRVEKLSWGQVVKACPRCERRKSSHGAMWAGPFAETYFPAHIQPFIEHVRGKVREAARRGPGRSAGR